MGYPKLLLKEGREKSLFYKHPWIFSGAIQNAAALKDVEDGSVVDVVGAGGGENGANGTNGSGKFLARGYYNSQSNIAVRVLTFEDEMIDADFLEKRLRAAMEARRPFLQESDTNAYRLVFAEGDGLPGLVVDRYDDVLVVQIHTLGMDVMRAQVVEALVKVFGPRAIYERSDVSARKQDGLNTMPKGVLFGSFEQGLKEVREHGMKFLVDIAGGQKTGFFLDQRENRATIEKYAKGKTVLNLFAYSGGFSCYALRGGAERVTSVDISGAAIDLCKKNVALNEFEEAKHEGVVADVFEWLEKTALAGHKFDVVIVDPPAFVKSAKNLKNGLKAYAKLNEQALRVLADGGILVSSSCSSHVTPDMFKTALFQSALRTRDDLTILEQRTQPFDHPNRLYFPEGEYLKFFVLQ